MPFTSGFRGFLPHHRHVLPFGLRPHSLYLRRVLEDIRDDYEPDVATSDVDLFGSISMVSGYEWHGDAVTDKRAAKKLKGLDKWIMLIPGRDR